MKRQIALTFALVAGGLTLAVAPALAGKGGGSGGSTAPPSIAIATINGTSAALLAIALDHAPLAHQGRVLGIYLA